MTHAGRLLHAEYGLENLPIAYAKDLYAIRFLSTVLQEVTRALDAGTQEVADEVSDW